MYQHHIMLKTQQPLDSTGAIKWYNAVRDYGPDGIIYQYQYGDTFVGMEYSTCDCEDFTHCYVVPLMRNMTEAETQIVLAAWEYMFAEDFDIEISSQYDENPGFEIDIDAEVMESALANMGKWHHNRWVTEMTGAGWRHGQYFSESKKTHPALRQWDDLPESHRRTPEFTNEEVYHWLRKLI